MCGVVTIKEVGTIKAGRRRRRLGRGGLHNTSITSVRQSYFPPEPAGGHIDDGDNVVVLVCGGIVLNVSTVFAIFVLPLLFALEEVALGAGLEFVLGVGDHEVTPM